MPCTLKPRCCPGVEARKVTRSVHEGARNLARAIAEEDEWLTSQRERKKVEMLFEHLKRILRLDRDYAARTAPETSSTWRPPPRTSESLPSSSRCRRRRCQPAPRHRPACPTSRCPLLSTADFFNNIGQLQSLSRTGRHIREGPRPRFHVGCDLALANGFLERGMIAFGLVCVGYREIAHGFVEFVARSEITADPG